jgi:hypothetical protein
MRSFPERERQKNSYHFIRKFIFDAKGGKEEAVETIKVDILLSLSLCAFCVYVCSWFFSTPASRSFNHNARRKKKKKIGKKKISVLLKCRQTTTNMIQKKTESDQAKR